MAGIRRQVGGLVDRLVSLRQRVPLVRRVSSCLVVASPARADEASTTLTQGVIEHQRVPPLPTRRHRARARREPFGGLCHLGVWVSCRRKCACAQANGVLARHRGIEEHALRLPPLGRARDRSESTLLTPGSEAVRRSLLF